jgi:hypothetical protein
MKRLILSSIAGFILATAWTVQAAQPQAQVQVNGKQQPITAQAINNQAAVSCNICFTCGGDWPVFSGSIRSVGDFPTERGSSCSGALQGRTDSSPFLCCN